MQLPTLGRWSRLLALGYGIVVFLWLSVEDVAVWPVTLLGVGLAALIGVLLTLDKMGGRWLTARTMLILLGLLGTAVGLGASVTAALLMFFKNARHAHLFPDYPAGMMLAMLERAPAWAMAGGLIGLSLGLAWLVLRRDNHE